MSSKRGALKVNSDVVVPLALLASAAGFLVIAVMVAVYFFRLKCAEMQQRMEQGKRREERARRKLRKRERTERTMTGLLDLTRRLSYFVEQLAPGEIEREVEPLERSPRAITARRLLYARREDGRMRMHHNRASRSRL